VLGINRDHGIAEPLDLLTDVIEQLAVFNHLVDSCPKWKAVLNGRVLNGQALLTPLCPPSSSLNGQALFASFRLLFATPARQ
jgi:hypothetical protein